MKKMYTWENQSKISNSQQRDYEYSRAQKNSVFIYTIHHFSDEVGQVIQFSSTSFIPTADQAVLALSYFIHNLMDHIALNENDNRIFSLWVSLHVLMLFLPLNSTIFIEHPINTLQVFSAIMPLNFKMRQHRTNTQQHRQIPSE